MLTKEDLQVIAECLDAVRKQCNKASLPAVYGVMQKVDALLADPAYPPAAVPVEGAP